jgi:hypothetical protein
VRGCQQEPGKRQPLCAEHAQLLDFIGKDGLAWRFCWRCKKFHVLDAFDGAKRTCRTVLERRNWCASCSVLRVHEPQTCMLHAPMAAMRSC